MTSCRIRNRGGDTMMALTNVQNRPVSGSVLSPTYRIPKASDGQDDQQAQDITHSLHDPHVRPCSPDATGTPERVAAGQSAHASLAAFRGTMLSFLKTPTGLTAETTGESDGSTTTTGGRSLRPEEDLRTSKGRDACWKSLSDRFEVYRWYKDHIDARLLGAEKSSLRIEPAAEGQLGVNTQA
jgi:hypothetical protein